MSSSGCYLADCLGMVSRVLANGVDANEPRGATRLRDSKTLKDVFEVQIPSESLKV